MRKIFFIVAIGLGFILGSRVGMGPYEQLEHRIKGAVATPEVKAKVEKARSGSRASVPSLTT